MKILNIYQIIGAKYQSNFFDDTDYFGIQDLDKFLTENKDEKDILIRLSTPGGSLFEAVGIFDKLKASGKNITTLSEGIVASAGTVIMLAGQKRQSLPNTSFLVHNVRVSMSGEDVTASDLQTQLNNLNTSDETLKKIYKENLPSDKINDVFEVMGKEEFINAQKMLEFGFITEIVSEVDNIKNLNLIINNKNKEKMDKTVLEQITKGFAEIKAFLAGTVKNLAVKLKNGDTMEVSELKEGADTPASDGTYETEDGTMVTVAGGKITKIEAPKAPEDDDEMAKLKAEVARLTAELDKKKKDEEEMTAQVSNVLKEMETIRTTVAKFNVPAPKAVTTPPAPAKEKTRTEEVLEAKAKIRNVKK
jgi:ATP-dependent protease ClpP protease subunit